MYARSSPLVCLGYDKFISVCFLSYYFATLSSQYIDHHDTCTLHERWIRSTDRKNHRWIPMDQTIGKSTGAHKHKEEQKVQLKIDIPHQILHGIWTLWSWVYLGSEKIKLMFSSCWTYGDLMVEPIYPESGTGCPVQRLHYQNFKWSYIKCGAQSWTMFLDITFWR